MQRVALRCPAATARVSVGILIARPNEVDHEKPRISGVTLAFKKSQ